MGHQCLPYVCDDVLQSSGDSLDDSNRLLFSLTRRLSVSDHNLVLKLKSS